MHTFDFKGGYIHYNSDRSGMAIIGESGNRVDVPCQVLVDFVAHLVAMSRVEAIEGMSSEEVLGLYT